MSISLYQDLMLEKIGMILILFGSLQFFFIVFYRTNIIRTLFGDGFLSNIIYVLMASATLYFMVRRDTYLPFLGRTVVPCSVLEPRIPPGATKEITISTEPNKKIIYWAANRTKTPSEVQTWDKAYGLYENAGVALSDASGMARLKVNPPQPYSVPIKGKLDSHVHYRVCGEPGWMGSIQTIMISDEPEGFQPNERSFEEY